MRRLAAIAAIFGTAAGLDLEQPAHLHVVGVEMAPMHRVGGDQQIIERSLVKCQRLRPGPIVPDATVVRVGFGCRALHGDPVTSLV